MANATVFVQDPALPVHRAAIAGDTLVDGSGNPLGGGVPTTRTIATTAPLTGGGDLSADRTLAVSTFGTSQSGVVPSSGGGTANYLRADGTWAAPPGTGGAVTSVFGRTGVVTATGGDYTAAQVGAAPTTRSIGTTAPLAGGGDLSADRTLTVSNATALAVGVVQLTGDLGGTATSPTVPGLTSKAPTSRLVNTTAPLTGGGDLSADRTLAVSDFVASGASHARGTVPDPGSSAGTTRFLREDATWAAPGGGSDPWTNVILASGFPTTSATAVNVTGLFFTPVANTTYEFEAWFLLRTATATVGPRPGLSWPTGCTDGVVMQQVTSAAASVVSQNGNITAAMLGPVGGLPTTTGSWPGYLWGAVIVGGSPSGNMQIQLASETSGTTVTLKAGSYFRYRTIA